MGKIYFHLLLYLVIKYLQPSLSDLSPVCFKLFISFLNYSYILVWGSTLCKNILKPSFNVKIWIIIFLWIFFSHVNKVCGRTLMYLMNIKIWRIIFLWISFSHVKKVCWYSLCHIIENKAAQPSTLHYCILYEFE